MSIVTAAADLIRRTGIAEASLADMMAAAGLTHGGFYRHFRNKEHLVSEAFSAASNKTVATISRTTGGSDILPRRRESAVSAPGPTGGFASRGANRHRLFHPASTVEPALQLEARSRQEGLGNAARYRASECSALWDRWHAGEPARQTHDRGKRVL